MTRRLLLPLAVIASATALWVVAVRLPHLGAHARRAVDDLGQLVAATAASAAAGWRARQAPSRVRRPWALLSVGAGAWALGECAWSYFELIAGRQTPFPSVADAGFLLFPPFAAAGLLWWPSTLLRGARRWRALLDGVLVAGALLIVSWVTALGTTVRAGGDGWFAYSVALAYPISDLVLLTLTVLVVTHSRSASRTGIGLLAIALGSLAVADSGFAYLVATGRYSTGSPVDVGWVGGFLLIAAAAGSATSAGPDGDEADPLESTARALLPYIPAAVGLGVALTWAFTDRDDHLVLAAAAVIVAVLLGRQLLAVLDNRRLVRELVSAQNELRHQAFHDPLTGLANRALFANRLRHGLELHRRDLRPLSLLYCDLDGFKTINDTLGHDVGDGVIRSFAERLLAVTRPGDTVARTGGDEFAILVEDGGDALGVAARIFAAFAQPTPVGRHSIRVTASIGIAELGPSAAPTDPESILRRADIAMYHAKRHGKGAAVVWTEDLESGGERTPVASLAPIVGGEVAAGAAAGVAGRGAGAAGGTGT